METKYIDLLCLETNVIQKQVLQLLRFVKNSRLKTKVLSIIPNNRQLKNVLLSYGCDDYICKPYNCEDLILRCKKLIKCMPLEYNIVYENSNLRYEKKFNRIMYKNTYIPLTPTEILIVKLLIKETFISKLEFQKYLKAKVGKQYSYEYITVMIHRARNKIRLCTGRNLIRNKYGSGYYIP